MFRKRRSIPEVAPSNGEGELPAAAPSMPPPPPPVRAILVGPPGETRDWLDTGRFLERGGPGCLAGRDGHRCADHRLGYCARRRSRFPKRCRHRLEGPRKPPRRHLPSQPRRDSRERPRSSGRLRRPSECRAEADRPRGLRPIALQGGGRIHTLVAWRRAVSGPIIVER